jgi:predicted transcriptional regulator
MESRAKGQPIRTPYVSVKIVFAWLVEHGYLSKSDNGYQITPLGFEVIQRKRVIG